MGLFAMMFSASFVVSPIIGMNLAKSYGWNILWIVMIVFCFIGVTGIYFLKDVVEQEKEAVLAKKEGALV